MPAYVPEMVELLRIQKPLKKLYTKKTSKRIIYQMERIRMKIENIVNHSRLLEVESIRYREMEAPSASRKKLNRLEITSMRLIERREGAFLPEL